MKTQLERSTWMRRINGLIVIGAAAWFFLLPGAILMRDLSDPALRQPVGIPRVAWRMHASLTPRYATWARARVESGRAAQAPLYDVVATEWAMFGSVFYLTATENLQREWEKHPGRPTPTAPAVYARETIEAAADLVLDPAHHTWVKTHWGADYLHRENVFFRAMLIQAMMARENLIRDGRDLPMLRDQVETLSSELDAAPHGLLNDYPAECYPIDVFAAVAMIRRADSLLGTDHSAFVERQRRAFSGSLVDACGLPGYFAAPKSGQLEDSSRGIGNSYVLIYCPELYPDWAPDWYDRYVKGFWQHRMGAAGFREYARDVPGKDWFYDVDAGPVIAGFGPAANAYGVAAARANGRFDNAWTLSSQVLAASWPLPGGVWLGARILSNAAHAPYLGEANLLFLFTTMPAPGVPIRTGGAMPLLVYLFLIGYIGLGLFAIVSGVRGLRRAGTMPLPPGIRVQFVAWAVLLAGGVITFAFRQTGIGVILLLAAQFFPRGKAGPDKPRVA
jgi:hypothetical protein